MGHHSPVGREAPGRVGRYRRSMRGRRRGHLQSVFSFRRRRVIYRRNRRVAYLWITLRGSVRCWGTRVKRRGRYRSTFCIEMSDRPQRKQIRDDPLPPGVLMAAAAGWCDVAASVAAADASAAADVARGAVKPTAADTARGAAKPTAVDDDEAGGLCRCASREHYHGLRGPLEPRRRAPGLCLAALHLWPGHGYRRHFRTSLWSPRSVPGLPPVNQAQCLPSSKTFLFNIESGRKVIQDSTIKLFFCRTDAVLFEFHHQGCCSDDIVPDGLFFYLQLNSSNFFFTLSRAASLLSPTMPKRIFHASKGDSAVIIIS